MRRIALTDLVLRPNGRGPALRWVEVTLISGSVRAVAISREHLHRGTVVGLQQVCPYRSPRLFALIADAVLRELRAHPIPSTARQPTLDAPAMERDYVPH